MHMKKWIKTAGLLFMAAASVYSDQAIAAKPGTAAKPTNQAPSTDVKLLEEADPFATGPTSAPSTTVSEVKAPAAPVQVKKDCQLGRGLRRRRARAGTKLQPPDCW